MTKNVEASNGQPDDIAPDSHSTGRRPPNTKRKDVVDMYHGVKVIDPYRWLETQSAERDGWLVAQNAYTRQVLDAVRGREALRDELREANRGVERVEVLRVVGDVPRIFALHRVVGDESAKLVVRDGWNGVDQILVDPSSRGGRVSHVTIDEAAPSPDGRYVAYVASAAGSEDGTIEIVDVESRRLLPDRIDRTTEPKISWHPDGRSFFYWRRGKRGPDWKPSDYLKDGATNLHVLGSDPNAATRVIGAGMPDLGLGDYDYTIVRATPRSRWVIARVTPTAAKFSFFVAPLARTKPGRTPWRRVATVEDGAVSMVVHGDRVFALTHAGAPNYRIVSFDARSGSIAKATDFVSQSDLVLDDLVAAHDALYVVALDRGIHRLFRVSWETAKREEVTLPFKGSIQDVVPDPTRSGLVFSMEGWIEPPGWFSFDPKSGKVGRLPIGSSLDAPEGLVAERATATSRDGSEVPLSIVRRRDGAQDGTQPTVLTAYGASHDPAHLWATSR